MEEIQIITRMTRKRRKRRRRRIDITRIRTRTRLKEQSKMALGSTVSLKLSQ
jgi:hypothetical protein